jgi:integrase
MDHRGDNTRREVLTEAPTLGSFLTSMWMPAIERTIRFSTAAGYRGHIRNHLKPELGHLRLHELDGPVLNEFYAKLLAPPPIGRGLSPTTVRRIHATLHRALRDAVRWGLVDVNAADQSDPPALRADALREMRTWTGPQVAAFLQAVKSHRLYPLWRLFAMTGLRRGEGLGLRRSDLDLPSKRLVVRQTLIDVGGKCLTSKPKTKRGGRVVALDEVTVRILNAHLAATDRADDAWLFTDRNGGHLNPGAVTREFVRLSTEAGLPRIRLHDLRHTHATLALEAGIHPKIVSERLGHSTVAFTLDVYSHSLGHMQAAAAEKIAEVVQPRSTP